MYSRVHNMYNNYHFEKFRPQTQVNDIHQLNAQQLYSQVRWLVLNLFLFYLSPEELHEEHG